MHDQTSKNGLISVQSLSWFGYVPQEIAKSIKTQNLLRLRDTRELILCSLTFIVLKSSILVLCIKWSHHHLQNTV